MTGGLTQASLRKIIAYSSISHLAWILSAIFINSMAWSTYFIIYLIITAIPIIILNNNQLFSVSKIINHRSQTEIVLLALALLSAAGLPPLIGFGPKLIITSELFKSNYAALAFPLLLNALISTIFYLRIITIIIFFSSLTNPNTNKPNSKPKPLYFTILVGLACPSFLFIFLF